MSLSSSILIYGRDLDLLRTRSWVLERAGYNVYLSLELDTLEQMMTAKKIELLILCHSLSPEGCDEALSVARAIRPETKVVLMTANTFVSPSGSRERLVSAFDGPIAMLTAVHRAFGREDGLAQKAKPFISASH